MLKGISPVLQPQMLKVLCEMGHGDRILIADGNFPAESMGKDSIVIRCDGHGAKGVLEAVLTVFPLDRSADQAVFLMAVSPGDHVKTPVWEEYRQVIARYDDRGAVELERFAFYEMSRNAYAIIATGEQKPYANVMLQKGVVSE